MAAFSVFFTQSPSFLDHQRLMKSNKGKDNAESLFSIEKIPGDNQIRNLLDAVPASTVSRTFQKVYQWLKEKGVLKKFLYLGFAEKAFRWWQGVAPPTPPTSGGQVGCGVWGFIDFQVVNYLIFREKVQEISPRSPQWLALFEGKKVQKSYPKRFLDLFSRPYLDGEILVALDGTEYFSYKKINCPHCNCRNHRNGTTTYFHGCVTPIVVSPNQKQVINLEPEFIKKQDGHQKQDCENAAVKRWLNKNHKNKYGYPVTLLGDDLYSHEPVCELAVKQGYYFIIMSKKLSKLGAADGKLKMKAITFLKITVII